MTNMIAILAVLSALGSAPNEDLLAPRVQLVQGGIAENMCGAYLPVVQQAIDLGQQGVPLSMAEDMADSALSLDRRLWLFVVESIQVAYSNPQAMSQALRDGRWMTLCVQAITS